MSNLKNQAPMIDPVIVRDADHKRPLEIGPSLPVAPFRDLIDRHQLAWYCRAIHELARGIEGIIIPMAICPSPTRNANDWNEHSRFRVGEIDPMISQIEDWVLRGANVYVPWCVFRPDTPPSSRGGRGHAISVLALVSDRDADNGKFGKTVARPTYQIISSRVPATNSNELYVFTQPVEPEAAAELGRKLRIAMGADSGTGDIVRLVRVAGTANFPSFKKISERQRPRQPQAVRFGDDATSEQIGRAHV